jgi:hypothetical protein
MARACMPIFAKSCWEFIISNSAIPVSRRLGAQTSTRQLLACTLLCLGHLHSKGPNDPEQAAAGKG